MSDEIDANEELFEQLLNVANDEKSEDKETSADAQIPFTKLKTELDKNINLLQMYRGVLDQWNTKVLQRKKDENENDKKSN